MKRQDLQGEPSKFPSGPEKSSVKTKKYVNYKRKQKLLILCK